ncbi:hypothetical protein FNF27_08013 [Cafeteria roenbergensis]|uniref:Uncharacterized protein n=1 Tax=Cafeteria roenbergensis TaxID=33653 RepID=A0A5A8DFB0_CAFRO|nr:hypothetical protein FNF27_08013 [Cafeteria roenbergensis]
MARGKRGATKGKGKAQRNAGPGAGPAAQGRDKAAAEGRDWMRALRRVDAGEAADEDGPVEYEPPSGAQVRSAGMDEEVDEDGAMGDDDVGLSRAVDAVWTARRGAGGGEESGGGLTVAALMAGLRADDDDDDDTDGDDDSDDDSDSDDDGDEGDDSDSADGTGSASASSAAASARGGKRASKSGDAALLRSGAVSALARAADSLSRAAPALTAPSAKPVQQRAARQAAYEAVSDHVGRWEGAVRAERRAAQINFVAEAAPVGDRLRLTTAGLLGSFAPETSAEQQMAAALAAAGVSDASGIAQAEAEAASLLAAREETPAERKRREDRLQRLRAVLLWEEEKRRRSNKSKSKSYRRVKKRAEKRAEAAERERLRKEDPERAAELDEKEALDFARARATLRTEGGSKWVRRVLREGAAGAQHCGAGAKRAEVLEALREADELRKRVRAAAGAADEDDDEDDEDEDDASSDDEDGAAAAGGRAARAARRRAEADTLEAAAAADAEAAGLGPDATSALLDVRRARVNVLRDVGLLAANGAMLTEAELAAEEEAEAEAAPGVAGMAFMRAAGRRAREEARSAARRLARSLQTEERRILSGEAPRDSAELIRRAFAGTGATEAELDAEKRADAEMAADQQLMAEAGLGRRALKHARATNKSAADILGPTSGWGAWAGKGAPAEPQWMKRQRKEAEARVAERRKSVLGRRLDAHSRNTVLSERRDRKLAKHQIQPQMLPVQFQGRREAGGDPHGAKWEKGAAAYERSLRQPLGRDWNTKSAAAALAAPEVITRAGLSLDPATYAEATKRRSDVEKSERAMGQGPKRALKASRGGAAGDDGKGSAKARKRRSATARAAPALR